MNGIAHTDKMSQAISGELQGVTSATQLPNRACTYLKLKAQSSNAGSVYIGGSGVTLPDGTTDITSGLELGPGEETGWMPVQNLNMFYYICQNAGDDLTYLALLS